MTIDTPGKEAQTKEAGRVPYSIHVLIVSAPPSPEVAGAATIAVSSISKLNSEATVFVPGSSSPEVTNKAFHAVYPGHKLNGGAADFVSAASSPELAGEANIIVSPVHKLNGEVAESVSTATSPEVAVVLPGSTIPSTQASHPGELRVRTPAVVYGDVSHPDYYQGIQIHNHSLPSPDAPSFIGHVSKPATVTQLANNGTLLKLHGNAREYSQITHPPNGYLYSPNAQSHANHVYKAAIKTRIVGNGNLFVLNASANDSAVPTKDEQQTVFLMILDYNERLAKVCKQECTFKIMKGRNLCDCQRLSDQCQTSIVHLKRKDILEYQSLQQQELLIKHTTKLLQHVYERHGQQGLVRPWNFDLGGRELKLMHIFRDGKFRQLRDKWGVLIKVQYRNRPLTEVIKSKESEISKMIDAEELEDMSKKLNNHLQGILELNRELKLRRTRNIWLR